jgi:hypothetical protein
LPTLQTKDAPQNDGHTSRDKAQKEGLAGNDHERQSNDEAKDEKERPYLGV